MELRSAWRVFVWAFKCTLWGFATVLLGARALWSTGRLLFRYRQIVAETRTCDRGHEVIMYGLFDCRCGSRIEGWVFDRCPVCGESAGYIPCPTCGRPVRNPLLP